MKNNLIALLSLLLLPLSSCGEAIIVRRTLNT